MKTGFMRTFEELMVAVTFAEKNQHDFALEIQAGISEKKRRKVQKRNEQQHENRGQLRL